MTDEDAARIGRELEGGRAAVAVLTWDYETGDVTAKLKELGGTPQAHEATDVPAGHDPWAWFRRHTAPLPLLRSTVAKCTRGTDCVSRHH
jgi:hypothetical protein